MGLKAKFPAAMQALVAALMVAILAAACGGGSPSAQTYTATAGVGEIMQVSLDTSKMTYNYTVQETSYAASGVAPGQSGTGSIAQNADGSFNLSASSDGYILGGKILARQNGLLGGHVQLRLFGSATSIPLFGLSAPNSNLGALAGTYTYQGFSCSASGVASALGNPACVSSTGTITITSAGTYTMCKGGDINTSPGLNACVTTTTGSINAVSSVPGLFDFLSAANAHIGWVFTSTAPNGQNVAAIDHDDAFTPAYGHSVLSSYASAVAGVADGSYLVSNNESGEQMVTISGASMVTTAIPGAVGTLTFNSPWPGLSAFQYVTSGVVASSGVAMTGGTGAFTYTSKIDAAVFGAGVR